MCVCACMKTYVFMYMDEEVCVYVRVCMKMHVCMYMYEEVCMYVRVCMKTYVCMYVDEYADGGAGTVAFPWCLFV